MPLVRASVTPTISAGRYAVGDAIGSQMQFNVGANKGLIYGCRVLDKARQRVPLGLWLSRASTTGTGLANNEIFAPTDTQLANLAGVIRINEWFASAGNSIGQPGELPFSFTDLSGGLFYGWLVSRGEPTYASTSDLTVELEADRAASSINRRRRVYYYPRRNPQMPYDVGDAVGRQIEFNAGMNSGAVVGCRVLDKGRQSAPLELWLFRASTTGLTLANNEPFAPSDSQAENLVGVVRISDWFASTQNSVGQAENLPLQFGGLTNGALYGWLVTRGTPAYARNDLKVELQFEKATTSVNRRRRVYYRPRQYPPLTPLTITQMENYHTVHLKFEYTDPSNVPPSYVQITGSYLLNGRWVEFHPALRDSGGATKLYTILFGLQEDTTYPVKIQFSRKHSTTRALIESKTYHKTYKTRKSPTYDPTIDDATCIFVSKTATNDNGNGTVSQPKKTLDAARAACTGSKTKIILEDGVYDRDFWNFDSLSGDVVVNGLDGTAAAYKVIRARNPGQVTVSGKKVITGSGIWTKHTAGYSGGYIYYTSFTGYVDTASPTKRASLVMRNELTTKVLFAYEHLTTDNGSFQAIQNGTWEGFLYDWQESRLYVRVVGSDTAPAQDQYSVGEYKYYLVGLVNCDYVIVEGIKFEMHYPGEQVGSNQYKTGGTAGRFGVQIQNCTNIVFRNCQWYLANLGTFSTGATNYLITIEDCTYIGPDWWGTMFSDPFDDNTTWDRIKNSGRNEVFAFQFITGANDNRQLVFRRNKLSKGFWGITTSDGTPNVGGTDDSDIYDNVATDFFDCPFNVEFEGKVNTALWGNRIENTLLAIDLHFGPGFSGGPLWIVSNFAKGVVFAGSWSGGTPGDDGIGWALYYHNTLWTDYTIQGGAPNGVHPWTTQGGQGNHWYLNNIYGGTGDLFIAAGDGFQYRGGNVPGMQYDTGLVFVTNSFYSTDSDPEWHWTVDYETEAAWSAAANADSLSNDVTVTGNTYAYGTGGGLVGIHPFPNGIDNALNPALAPATYIKGITNIAADEDGKQLPEPIPRGHFPKWET